jgi:hypothetical protein
MKLLLIEKADLENNQYLITIKFELLNGEVKCIYQKNDNIHIDGNVYSHIFDEYSHVIKGFEDIENLMKLGHTYEQAIEALKYYNYQEAEHYLIVRKMIKESEDIK